MRMFRAALDYHELNAGAHRKFPKVLTAPSMIWHLAFWTNVRRKKTPDQIKETLDKFIIAFCGAVAGKVAGLEISPSVNDICLLFNNACHKDRLELGRVKLDQRQYDILASTRRVVSVRFVWSKLDVTIRFEIHTEYFSISTYVELNTMREKIGMPYSDVTDLDRNIRAVVDYLKAPAKSPVDDKLMEGINKYFFRDFWKTYETEFLSHESLKVLMKDRVFKQVFADFRGLIASDQAVKFADDEFFNENKPPKWGQEAKEKFLPLIQHRNRVEQTRYECAMNYMLNGRAFYMSTLGPQAPSISARVPVEFVVYVHQCTSDGAETIVNNWQLGRLVDQILLLDTLRLCALKDVKFLHAAGQQLEQLDESTQAAREGIAATQSEVIAANGNPLTIDFSVAELLRNAQQKLNRITGDFLTRRGSGLLYRVERSRYYVQQFNDNVKQLRIKRLEGDQPYDQFIMRRLGFEFDFIDRLGVRYERAARNLTTLEQAYIARSHIQLVARTVEIDEEAKSIQSDIQTIQAGGEAILLAFLVPYYVSHLLVLIVGEDTSYVPIMTVNIWLIGFASAVGRISKKLTLATALRFFLLLFVLLALLFPIESKILERVSIPKHPKKTEAPSHNPDAQEVQRRIIEMQEIQKQILESQRKLEQSADDGLSLLRKSTQPETKSNDENRNAPPARPPAPEPKL
jgi:hypothetical protein